VILALILAWSPADDWKPVYELAMVAVGFPALLALRRAVRAQVRRNGRLFSIVGLVSYGLYIIHQPIGYPLAQHPQPRGPSARRATGRPSMRRPFLGLLVAAAWGLDKVYDGPGPQAVAGLVS